MTGWKPGRNAEALPGTDLGDAGGRVFFGEGDRETLRFRMATIARDDIVGLDMPRRGG